MGSESMNFSNLTSRILAALRRGVHVLLKILVKASITLLIHIFYIYFLVRFCLNPHNTSLTVKRLRIILGRTISIHVYHICCIIAFDFIVLSITFSLIRKVKRINLGVFFAFIIFFIIRNVVLFF